MRLTLLMLACVLILGCAHNDPWTKRDTVLQVAYTATLVADAITTSRIQYHSNIQEVKPFAQRVLGRQPSTAGTWQYFASLAVTNALVTRALPAEWRPYWQGANITQHTVIIIRNCHIGLC